MSTYTHKFPDPSWIEKDRLKPVSLIPYVGQHRTFRCEACKGGFPRTDIKKDGKRNLCPKCFEKVAA